MYCSSQVAQLLECCPVHQKVAGLIPGQASYLGCRFSNLLGAHMERDQPLFLPLSLKKKTINKHILGWGFLNKFFHWICIEFYYTPALC